MERKLRTSRGRRLYAKRCQTVEPVFGQHELRGGKSLCRRGMVAADSEWKLQNTTHNLLKLWRSGRHTLSKGSRKLRESGAMAFARSEQGAVVLLKQWPARTHALGFVT